MHSATENRPSAVLPLFRRLLQIPFFVCANAKPPHPPNFESVLLFSNIHYVLLVSEASPP